MNIFKNKKAQFFAILTVIFTLIILGLILGQLFSSRSAYTELSTAGDRASEVNDALGRVNAKNEYLKRLIDLAFEDTVSNLSNEGGLPQKPCGSYRRGNIMYFGNEPTDCAFFDNVFDAFDTQISTSLFDRLAKEEKEITKPSLENIEVSLSENSEESASFKEYKYISINSSEKVTEPIRSTQFLKEHSIFEEVESIVTTTSLETSSPLVNTASIIPIDLLCNKTEDTCNNYYTKYINYIGIEKLRRLAKFYNLELKSVVIAPQTEGGNKPNLACFSVFNSSGPLYDSNCNGLGCSGGMDLEIQYKNSYLPEINTLLKYYFPTKCILAKTKQTDFVLYKNIDPMQSDNFYCWDVNFDSERETKKSIDNYNSKVRNLYREWFSNGYPYNNADNYFEAYQFCVPLYDTPAQLTTTLMVDDEMFSGKVFGSFGNYLTLPYQYFKRYGELKSIVQGLIEDSNEKSVSIVIHSSDPKDHNNFRIADAKKFETLLESEFYNFVDEFIKTIESDDFECVNPEELIALYERSEELKKYNIHMNSTHFYINISETAHAEAESAEAESAETVPVGAESAEAEPSKAKPPEIMSAPKLNGFSKSISPVIELGYCKTDLLGMPFIESDEKYDEIILSSRSENIGMLNWYKINENRVCLSDQKFSEQSKLYLAEKYIEQFQINTGESETTEKFSYALLIFLIEGIIGKQPYNDNENFCDYLKAKKFENVDEIFTECSPLPLPGDFQFAFKEFNFPEVEGLNTDRMVVLDSGKDFFGKLDKLKKEECILNQNWHSLVFIDTTYSFFKEVEIEEGDSTKTQIELVNPTYFVSFFKANYDPSDFKDLAKEKNSLIISLGGGTNWEAFEAK